MVINARPLTIKGENINLKPLKNELTRNVMSGVWGDLDSCQKKK